MGIRSLPYTEYAIALAEELPSQASVMPQTKFSVMSVAKIEST
jgi:hypothetical protein